MTTSTAPRRKRTVVCPCGSPVTHTMSGTKPVEWHACTVCERSHPFSSYEKMDIGLSEYCNLKCQMCRRPSDALFLDAERCKKAITEAVQVGVEVISFSGGEPFVHPRILEILEHSFALGVRVQMVTNGTIIKEHQLDFLSRLDCITVSVDGLGDVHDRIRGRAGAFERTDRFLRWLARTSICWGTNTVMQRDNAHQLYDVFRHVQAIGGQRYSYCGFVHVEVVPETSHLQMTPEQERQAHAQLMRIDQACALTDTYFNDRQQLLDQFEVYSRKEKRYRPAGGCRIPQKFIGFTTHGFYLCWHTGRNIQADSLIVALESDEARQLVREGLEKRCVACNTFNYSWDKEWTAGIGASVAAGDCAAVGVIPLGLPNRQQLTGPTAGNTVPFLDD